MNAIRDRRVEQARTELPGSAGATVERLLAGLDQSELRSYVDSHLGALLVHDAARPSPLLPVLAAYLDSGGRKAQAARELHMSRRALYYKLDRIELLLGRSLADPESRTRLTIALRGLSVLRDR